MRREKTVRLAGFPAVFAALMVIYICSAPGGGSDAGPPAQPSGLVAECIAPNTVRIAWNPECETARWFRIEHMEGRELKEDGYLFRGIGYAGPGQNSFIHAASFEPGSRHMYRVSALNDAGDSVPSEIAAEQVPSCDDAIAGPLSADAGADLYLRFPRDEARLAGRILSDRPDADIRWEQLSGPAEAGFSTPEAAETDVTFPEGGIYYLRLSVDDGEHSAQDLVKVHVFPEFEQINAFLGYFPGTRTLTVVFDAARNWEQAEQAEASAILEDLTIELAVKNIEDGEPVIETTLNDIEWQRGYQHVGAGGAYGGPRRYGRRTRLGLDRNILEFHLISTEYTTATPELDGVYQLVLRVFKNGRLVRTITRDEHEQPLQFERRRFEWENNTLGVSDEVFPPFEPIEVTGRSVSVVLREYHLNELGFLESVIADGRELLAEEMTLNFHLKGGEPGRWDHISGRFIRTEPHKAVYEGKAEAGPLQVHTTSTMDYDGAMKVEMELLPGTEGGQIENLYLEIPLRKEMAELQHIIKGLISRANPARRLQAWRTSSFVPYIWLGDADRGLAWFADNEDGYIIDRTDAHTPAFGTAGGVGSVRKGIRTLQQILVEDDRAVIRIYFVNRRTEITALRRIVFGLQASPAKPMPEDFRNPADPVPPHGGNNIYWAMRTWYSCRHPARPLPTLDEEDPDRDPWHIIDVYDRARRDRKHISEEYFEEWLQKRYGRMPEDVFHTYRIHLRSRFARIPPAAPTLVFFNFYAQSWFEPEWLTYQDEWDRRDFREVRRTGGWGSPRMLWLSPESRGPEYGGARVITVNSFRDWSAWNLREWYRRGLGIYDDDGYAVSTNVHSSNAFRHGSLAHAGKSEIVRSHGIWQYREYNKRNWVLMQQTQPDTPFRLMKSHHMTNDMVIPVMSWNDTLLDLEWSWRGLFPPEMLRVHTTGRQAGTYPHAHEPIFRLPKHTWGDGWLVRQQDHKDHQMALRADWGMHVVHDILRTNYGRHEELESILRDCGYGKEEAAVFNYWEENYPVGIDSRKVKSLAVEKDGRWLIVLVSWHPEALELVLNLDRIAAAGAQNAETGEPLKLDGRSLPVSLDRFGVKLVLLEDARALAADGGGDQRVQGNNARLAGKVKRYGEFAPGMEVTVNWRQMDGPGEATFADDSAADTQVSFSQPGSYTLRLTAECDRITAHDHVLINVVGH